MLAEVKVLDKGYVRYLDSMGTDLSNCNDAYASFERASATFGGRQGRLLHFLADRNETAPFRHAVLKLGIKAPLMVARQLYKYSVACCQREDQLAWSEVSRRYVTGEPEFYTPSVWRSAPESKKQGSGEPLSLVQQAICSGEYQQMLADAMAAYDGALGAGMAPEQARLFLPAYALYVSWHMTLSLAAVAHLLAERLPEDAQWETQQYAQAMRDIVSELFPVSTEALLKGP